MPVLGIQFFHFNVWNWSQRCLGWKMLAEFLCFSWGLCGSPYTKPWSVIQRSSSYQHQLMCVNMFPQHGLLLHTSSSEVAWSCCQSQGKIWAGKYCLDSSASWILDCWIPGPKEPVGISCTQGAKYNLILHLLLQWPEYDLQSLTAFTRLSINKDFRKNMDYTVYSLLY